MTRTDIIVFSVDGVGARFGGPAEGEIVLADQTACASCGTTNHGTKFCPECGAPGALAPTDEPALTQDPVSEEAESRTARVATDEPNEDEKHPTKAMRRVIQTREPVSRVLSTRRLTAWVGIACLLGIIGIAVGAAGIVQAMNAKNDVGKLRAQLQGLRHRVSGDEGHVGQVAQQMTTIPGRATMAAAQANIAAAQSQLTGLSRTVHGIQSQDARYTNCIPELQTELNGLTINWTIDAADVSQSSFFINNSSQVSHDCGKLLYGS